MENNIAYQTFNLINQERAKYGRPALGWDNSMYNLCLEHTNNLATGRAHDHDGFNSRTARIPFQWTKVAENVCYNYNYNDPASEAVRQWMTSQGHFNNILGDYNVSGLACVRGQNGAYYFTQLFAKRS